MWTGWYIIALEKKNEQLRELQVKSAGKNSVGKIAETVIYEHTVKPRSFEGNQSFYMILQHPVNIDSRLDSCTTAVRSPSVQ